MNALVGKSRGAWGGGAGGDLSFSLKIILVKDNCSFLDDLV